MRAFCCSALLLLALVQPAFSGQTIITVAGGGPTRGEGLATSVSLANPNGMALDGAGNLFIADSENHRICRVDAASGQLTVLAGNGVDGYVEGPSSEALFSFPTAVAVDAAGNVYVADTFNSRVRVIDAASKVVSTFVGQVEDGRPATNNFQFDFPVGLAIDGAGNLYICDEGRNIIYKMPLAGGVPVAVAGDGSGGFGGDGGPATAAQLNDARRVAIDAAGNLFIADTANNRVRKVDAATGLISTIAGTGDFDFTGDGGPATAAAMNYVTSVDVDAAGNVYIVDADNYRIRRVDTAGVITTIAGTGFDGFAGDGGDPLKATFVFALDMAVDAAGTIFVADTFANRIRKIGNGLTTSYDSDGDGFPDHVEAAALTNPQSAASTPFSNQPLNAFDGFDLQKAAVKLDFAKANNDSIQFSGTLPIPDGVSVASAQLIADFGGVAAAFSLDSKGNSTPKGVNSFKLAVKPKDGISKFSCKLTKGSFATQFGDDNLLNAELKSEFLAIPATIYFGNKSFTNVAFTVYAAKAGKVGQSKTGSKAFIPGETMQSGSLPPRRGGISSNN
jgi:sugar lactone lactonase YvrE